VKLINFCPLGWTVPGRCAFLASSNKTDRELYARPLDASAQDSREKSREYVERGLTAAMAIEMAADVSNVARGEDAEGPDENGRLSASRRGSDRVETARSVVARRVRDIANADLCDGHEAGLVRKNQGLE
jgi:hypothetical protein